MRSIVFALGWLLCAGAAFAESRIALVIGNSAYETAQPLKNPQNDALDISVALEGLEFAVTLGRDLSRADMEHTIADFAQRAKTADVALFYYAGHGFQLDGHNFLVPVDAVFRSADDVAAQTVAVDGLVDSLALSQGVRLVFLDACRNNPFGSSGSNDPSIAEGLGRMGTGADFLFAYATQPDAVAYDGTGRNSFFTQALLNHIYTPGQDISDLMISVRRDVIAATGGKQVPWENSSLTRKVLFDQSPETISEETLFYQLASKTEDSDLLQLYVDTYPQGAHISEAKTFLSSDAATRTLGTDAPDNHEERLWSLVRRSRLRPVLEYYVERYPDGTHRNEADRLIALFPSAEDVSAGGLCEKLATHPRDATAGNSGVPFARLQQNAVTAIRACSAAVIQNPNLPHYVALLARATAASGDLARAVDLYKEAAAQDDLRAMVSLAQLMESGTGLKQDAAAALALYERAAKAGSHDAMINLAIDLIQGKKDIVRGTDLLREAAQGGSSKAKYNLGVLTQDGITGTPSEALDYFLGAAKEGEYAGYLAAAILLDEGRGVTADRREAAKLLLRGAAEDSGTIVSHLTQRSSEWSKETIKEVQVLLSAAGFYTGAIDGLAGPGFSAGLRAWRNGGYSEEVLTAH